MTDIHTNPSIEWEFWLLAKTLFLVLQTAVNKKKKKSGKEQ
jgi:hypothetical protein